MSKKLEEKTFSSFRKSQNHLKNLLELFSPESTNYSDVYILVSATITLPNTAAAGPAANNRKNIIIKTYTPFTNFISKINNTQIDNAKDIDILMPMYNLIEY